MQGGEISRSGRGGKGEGAMVGKANWGVENLKFQMGKRKRTQKQKQRQRQTADFPQERDASGARPCAAGGVKSMDRKGEKRPLRSGQAGATNGNCTGDDWAEMD